MQFGLYMPNYGVLGHARRLAQLAAEAEKAGWDGLFLWDHVALHAPEDPSLAVVDPWVALAAMAMTTKTMRLGITVTPLPRRRPWKVAREAVSVDRLSGGRLILGVGIGLGAAEWRNLGEETDLRRRGQMLDEALEILTGLWSGKPFHFSGKHYRVQEAHFQPTPVQSPRIPIWVGGFWPNKAPFRRMARWDGMFPLFHVVGAEQIPLLQEAIAFVLAERQKAGIDAPFDVIKVGVTLGDDAEEAAARVGPAQEVGATWWLELLMPEIMGFGNGDQRSLAPMRERIRQGPPRAGQQQVSTRYRTKWSSMPR